MLKKLLPRDSKLQQHGRNFLLGLFAGFCGATVGNPFYLLKSQFQTQTTNPTLSVGHQHHHKNIFSAFAHIYRKEGFRGYWQGYDAYLARVVAYSSVQLSSYDAIKEFFLGKGMKNDVRTHLLASFFTAGIATLFMQPFDMVTSRLMNQPVVDGRGEFYKGPLDCLVKVVKTEGVWALGKGTTANCLRLGPYTVLVFVFYEQLKILVNKN